MNTLWMVLSFLGVFVATPGAIIAVAFWWPVKCPCGAGLIEHKRHGHRERA